MESIFCDNPPGPGFIPMSDLPAVFLRPRKLCSYSIPRMEGGHVTFVSAIQADVRVFLATGMADFRHYQQIQGLQDKSCSF